MLRHARDSYDVALPRFGIGGSYIKIMSESVHSTGIYAAEVFILRMQLQYHSRMQNR
jgi:hypothetical protein